MVGSVAVATNRGKLCHPHVNDKEMAILEELFDVEVSKTTANHGSGWIGTCLIAKAGSVIVLVILMLIVFEMMPEFYDNIIGIVSLPKREKLSAGDD